MKKDTSNKKKGKANGSKTNNIWSGFGKVLINSFAAGISSAIIAYFCLTELNSFLVSLLTKAQNGEVSIGELILLFSVAIFALVLFVNSVEYFSSNNKKI